ncbi:hypothetical protein HYV49_00335 [Candidatus Pacearchaeota archaeon]|nr:hypothetical protein [Candidatus Pacearchaeota archaeon]
MEIAEKTKKLLEVKNQIISIIERRGPILPVHVAKETKLSILFASAFLSELVSERRIKISHMKVGGSPLYFIEGQENMLENFSQYLNSKEKEAFMLLKDNKALEDEKLEPAIRVALRGLKDFAFTFIFDGEKERLFWRYFTVFEEEARNLVKPKVIAKPTKERTEKRQREIKKEPVKETIEIERVEIKKPKKRMESDFVNYVMSHLNDNNIKIMTERGTKKKEYEAVIEMDSIVGKINFIVVAKDKKSINDADIALAAQKSQLEKMPILILSRGSLNKKASEYIKNWNGLVKFRQI